MTEMEKKEFVAEMKENGRGFIRLFKELIKIVIELAVIVGICVFVSYTLLEEEKKAIVFSAGEMDGIYETRIDGHTLVMQLNKGVLIQYVDGSVDAVKKFKIEDGKIYAQSIIDSNPQNYTNKDEAQIMSFQRTEKGDLLIPFKKGNQKFIKMPSSSVSTELGLLRE